jgi:hypothetical protein
MPSCDDVTSSPSPLWTAARAQAALSDAAGQLRAVGDRLEEIHEGLPPPVDFDDRLEGYRPYDVATDILGTIECIVEDCLRPAIDSLRRSARVTYAELEQEFYEGLKRRLT